MDPTYRVYSNKVPIYFCGRPQNIIIHCLAREEKARKTFLKMISVTLMKIREFLLSKESQELHTQLTLEKSQENRTAPVQIVPDTMYHVSIFSDFNHKNSVGMEFTSSELLARSLSVL